MERILTDPDRHKIAGSKMAAVAGFYRRKLPSPPAIEFASPRGKQLFAEALVAGNMEGFFKLISYYQTQSEPAYCGLATLSTVLNALAIDPGRKWKGPWRWFDDSMLDCCEPLEKIKVSGISFDKVACLAHCNGALVESFHTNETTVEGFRNRVISCTSSEDCHLIVSYHRGFLKQTGSGHFSPVGGYHPGQDLVLILDVARFKYPPHWVPLTVLWEAMDTIDDATGFHRGYMKLTRPQRSPSILYTVSCRHESWDATAKYLTEDVQNILSSNEINDVQELLAAVLTSAPADLRDLIGWVAEVRLQEGGNELTEEEKERLSLKEDVLNQVHRTELFDHVARFLASHCKSCSAEEDCLAKIGYVVCCQGAKILCGEIRPSSMPCCTTINTIQKNDPDDKSTVVISGGIGALIPCCRERANDEFAFNYISRKHPSVEDVITILLLALPSHTWFNTKSERLKEKISSLTATASLPPLLQEEVLHLRQQLHFLSRSLCLSSP